MEELEEEEGAIRMKHSLVVLQRVGAHRSGDPLQRVSHPQSMPGRWQEREPGKRRELCNKLG